ncbi:jg12173 [Pararge aegeria aegeria]|uniref:Jg12173 protein n=1 Tax=Pararge aegeria aegeria TaxID=348720 RepID=A0A8S4RPR1_9NEOP|nr:jg12173 [Pararge aegeria aegeria]
MANEGAAVYDDPHSFSKDEKRLTREYHLRQGALRGLIVKPGKNYDLQPVEMFLGIPYAAPPVGNLRFMPPVSAPPWPAVRMATRFAPVCPQSLPVIKKGNPPSLGRQHYLSRLRPFLAQESEDCLYLNIYVPYREHKSKKFPVLVFIHGDSFEWSSGNPYDGRILSSYGNVMVVTVNFRLGVLGFMKPSLTEHVYGNNGLLDQLAALQWIKDNIEDLNGDPHSVTLMGHGTGAACVNFLMLSPISNGLFHRAILMSGSALSDAAMTRNPTQYTLQVAQSLGCNPSSKNMMTCLQNKPLSEIKKVQILARRFETPLGPVVAGSFIPSEPANTMASFPNLLSTSPNTQSVNEYFTLDKKLWNQYNVEWPEYNVVHQPYLRIDLPPVINSLYRSNYTNFWIETLPNKMKRFMVDPLFEFTPKPAVTKPRPAHRTTIDRIEVGRKTYVPQVYSPSHFSSASTYGKLRPYSLPGPKQDKDSIYREIQAIKTPSRQIPPSFMEKVDREIHTTQTDKPVINMPVKTSSATVTLVVSLGVLFVAINIGICAVFYYKKKKSLNRTTTSETTHQPRAEIGEVDMIGQKSSKDDKSALQTFKNGCSVIKSISIHKMRSSNKKVKKKEVCKTPKSDDSGGFRERFQLRRHLSTSTLDAHTKVRDWIANEVMHRCSPSILRKSSSELNNKAYIGTKPFTRSEELLSDSRKTTKGTIKVDDSICPKNLLAKSYSGKNKTSEKTTSTSALDSHSSLVSNQQSTLGKRTNKSSDSLKSKGTDSIKSRKVSVAIDATPSARTNSILKQEPIELSKSLDEKETTHSIAENKLQRSKTDNSIKLAESSLNQKEESKIYTNEVTLSLGKNSPLKITHKHSSSDPVTDVNYELLQEKLRRENEIVDILPPVTFRNEVNVTSRDDKCRQPLSAEESLLTIKRRNFPKVLPDLPKAQKRLSLQPTSLQSFRGYAGLGSFENQVDRPKVPPQPPPRTTTLDRRLAYKNTKPLSSFDVSNMKKIPESYISSRNYENIDNLTRYSDNTKLSNKSFEYVPSTDKSHPIISMSHREYPKVIIASSDTPNTPEPTIIIKPSPSQIEISRNVARVRLPDDFHSHASGSVTSFSSFCSDDDIDDVVDETFLDDLAEDKLIQELVGGVESPTSMDVLDSKGPETIFEKKVEIVPVKINPTLVRSNSKDDYVCISDLLLPDISGTEPTAKIKPNFGLNKLKNRSESINRPPEKAVKVKTKRTIKPTGLLNRSSKTSKSAKFESDSSKLEHSNSGSSNDTETSTGTVINLK